MFKNNKPYTVRVNMLTHSFLHVFTTVHYRLKIIQCADEIIKDTISFQNNVGK